MLLPLSLRPSYLVVLDCLRGVVGVIPPDAGRLRIFGRSSIDYDDGLVRVDHSAVAGHRNGRQHVITLGGFRADRDDLGPGEAADTRAAVCSPVTIRVRMLARCRSCRTPAVSGLILFCMMIKPRKSMLVSIRSLKHRSVPAGDSEN